MAETLCDSPIKQGHSKRSPWILTSAETFGTDVVAESHKRPVLAFFYEDDLARHKFADHLKTAVEATGHVFKMALLNISEARQIAGQLGIREAPAVICFAEGHPIDGAMGELTLNQAFTFIERLDGNQVSQLGSFGIKHLPVTPPPDIGPIGNPSLQIGRTPENQELRFRLAVALNDTVQRERAADLLLELVRDDRSWRDDQARKQLIDFFDVWGPLDPTTVAFRRKLSAVLFS